MPARIALIADGRSTYLIDGKSKTKLACEAMTDCVKWIEPDKNWE